MNKIPTRKKWADGATRAIIAARIKQLRLRRGIKQKELAEGCGLSATHLNHFECGRRVPSVENLVRIASGLRVTTDYLCGLSHSPNPEETN